MSLCPAHRAPRAPGTVHRPRPRWRRHHPGPARVAIGRPSSVPLPSAGSGPGHHSHKPGLSSLRGWPSTPRPWAGPGATFPTVPFPGWLLSRAGRRDLLGHVGSGTQQRPPSPQACPGRQTARVPACAHALPRHTGESSRRRVPPATVRQTQWGPAVRPRRPLLREGPLGGLLGASDHLLADRRPCSDTRTPSCTFTSRPLHHREGLSQTPSPLALGDC